MRNNCWASPARLVSAMAVAVGCALPGGVTRAEESTNAVLEEVVVTAQLRSDKLRDVPVSLTAVEGERLYETGVTNLETLTPFVPNFSMSQTGTSSVLSIRGVSSGTNQGFEQSVGVYVDGLHYGRAQLSRAPLFDLERVEVLRGPQTVLFGKNSIAGAVSQITRRPTVEPDGFLSVEYVPEFNTQDYRFALGGALNEQLAGRLSLLYRDQDGWVENAANGADEPQSEDRVVRGSLAWSPTDRLGIWLKGEQSRWQLDGRNIEVFNSITHPNPAKVRQPGKAIQIDHISALNKVQAGLGRPLVDGELNGIRDDNGDSSVNDAVTLLLQIDYEVADAGTLTSISGLLDYDYDDHCDCDFTQASIIDADLGEAYRQLSQELRFTSARGGRLDYLAGLYFQHSELDFRDSINVTPDSLLGESFSSTATQREFEQSSRLWSAFGQLTWHVSDRVRLNLGGRYSYERKQAARSQGHVASDGVYKGTGDVDLNVLYNGFAIESYDTVKGERSESNFSPLLAVQWDVADSVMLYASAVRGFKSGGFDTRSNAHPDPAVVTPGTSPDLVGVLDYDPEQVDSFELGVKTLFYRGQVEVNAALFRMNYRDLQTSQYDGTLGFNVTNAAEAVSQGFEGDFRWRLAHDFMLAGNLAYLDFHYTDFANAQCYFGQSYLEPDRVTDALAGLCDAGGKRKEFAPEWRGALSADWMRNLGRYLQLRAVVDLIYSDAYLWSRTLDPRARQPAYTRLDARLSLGSQDGRWQVALVGRNLTDETVVTFGGDTPLAGSLTQGTGHSYYGVVQAPASVGLQMLYRFFR